MTHENRAYEGKLFIATCLEAPVERGAATISNLSS